MSRRKAVVAVSGIVVAAGILFALLQSVFSGAGGGEEGSAPVPSLAEEQQAAPTLSDGADLPLRGIYGDGKDAERNISIHEKIAGSAWSASWIEESNSSFHERTLLLYMDGSMTYIEGSPSDPEYSCGGMWRVNFPPDGAAEQAGAGYFVYKKDGEAYALTLPLILQAEGEVSEFELDGMVYSRLLAADISLPESGND